MQIYFCYWKRCKHWRTGTQQERRSNLHLYHTCSIPIHFKTMNKLIPQKCSTLPLCCCYFPQCRLAAIKRYFGAGLAFSHTLSLTSFTLQSTTQTSHNYAQTSGTSSKLWPLCTDGDVLSLNAIKKRRVERTSKGMRRGQIQQRNQNICSLLWEFYSFPSLCTLFPASLHPSITPLQTGLSLWGALSFPLGWSGSFQGTLMDANAGLFQIVLQPEPLICQQASLHGLPVLRKCKSPPYRHLWKKYSRKGWGRGGGRKRSYSKEKGEEKIQYCDIWKKGA